MSFKLTYTLNGETFEKDVNPSGIFSIKTTRDKYQYKDELSGTMTFKGEDFDFIMAAGACTKIYATCYFKRTWHGYFSHTDCSKISISKKYLEVQPTADDEYSKIKPWMDIDMNIVPPYDEIESKVPVYTVNSYTLETKRVRITTPYSGANSENWVGYSVNDWIQGQDPTAGFSYAAGYDKRNSLIHELTRNIVPSDFENPYNGSLIFPPEAGIQYMVVVNGMQYQYGYSDQDNQKLWLDYGGYERYINEGSLHEFGAIYRNSGFFTLTEVINFYSETGEWEYCDLIYSREVYDSLTPPPTGNIAPSGFDLQGKRGWSFDESEGKWYRRPLNAMDDYAPTDFTGIFYQWTVRSGDGTWFTPLFDSYEDGKNVKKQVLYRNRKAIQDLGSDWYRSLYGIVIYHNHFHKPIDLVRKFVSFIKDEGAITGLTKNDVVSSFWENDVNPWDGKTNLWKTVLLGQNSDIKRPYSSERATKELMSFDNYLDLICKLSNCAWAIIDGKLVIEHISYFERGLSYDALIPNSKILNPFSILSVAKNKGFMNLTSEYKYDKPSMPKFEIFKMEGGSEPLNHNTKVEYIGDCVNNLPKENTSEITIPTVIDYNYARSENKDEGISFVYTTWNYLNSPALDWDGYINYLMPFPDENGIYGYNTYFNLESLVRKFYNYGRVSSEALLNKRTWSNVFTFKRIIHALSFPYVEQSDNPYNIILTSLGQGIVRNVDFDARGNWLEYEIGLSDVEAYEPPEVTIDWHIHEQTAIASKTWVITHEMKTLNIMRPMVFDLYGKEIEYDSFKIVNNNTMHLGFSQPITGYAHFISLDIETYRFYEYYGDSDEWTIEHNLNVSPENTAISAILDLNNNEIRPDSIEYVDNNKIIVKFTQVVSGRVVVADVSYHVDKFESDVTASDEGTVTKTDNRVYGKPFVLMAGKEIIYNSHELELALRRIGFTDEVTAKIVVVEKEKN